MKLLLFLTVMMMPCVSANAQTSNPVRGDVNGDGIVNAADIVEIVNIIMNGDNGDNKVPAGVEAVDLGLPSGTLWANMNVGASKAEDYGGYFAWGETAPQSDNRYNLESYKWCNGSYNTLTKYCNKSSYGYNGFSDNLTVLLPEDDAATANWGGDWCMPTIAQFSELIKNTTSEWTTQNGMKGYKFTSKTNGNSIFLPAAGGRRDDYLSNAGSSGYYWSSTLYEADPGYARYLYFRSGGVYTGDHYRYSGLPVRPVRKN